MPFSSSDAARFESLFAAWDHPGSPGLAVGIVQQGRLVYTRGYGLANLEDETPITPSSVFHVASLSKQVTALLVIHLALEGKLSLDDDLHTYLPLLPLYEAPLTLRHCLWHTSGLRDQWELLYLAGWRDGDLVTTADIEHLLSQQHTLNFPPGTEFCYCNSGYTLLGLVIEQVTGLSLNAYAQQQLFHPLGMEHTRFQEDHTLPVKHRVIAYAPHQDGRFRILMPMFDTVGATGLLTTIEDLARWIAHLDTLYAADAELLAHLLAPGTLMNGQPLPYGGGLFLGQYRGWKTVYHTGSDYGYRAQMLWFPQKQEALLVLCNLSTINPRLLVQQMMDLLVDDEHGQTHHADVSFTSPIQVENDMQHTVGLYHHSPTEAVRRCFQEQGHLKLAYGAGTDLLPHGNGRFRIAGTVTEITFFTDPQDGQRWLEETTAEGLTMRFEAVAEASPTPEILDTYAGTYTSDEVATTYHVVVRDHALWLLHQKFPPRILSPTVSTCFWMDENIRLRFVSADGHIVGFQASTDRVRRVHFWKQPTEGEK